MRIIDNLMALSADKGHSPFPSSERAVCGFALWLVSFLALGEFMWREKRFCESKRIYLAFDSADL